ncbi:MAG: HD domain-containing protein [Dehalococcoidia bacterium]|nr:HD domain-containing protein [Dehalococcoidia bacterium]
MVYPESVKSHLIKAILNQSTACILTQLQSALKELNTEAYIIGGMVRNLTLKRHKADIDIAVNGNALTIGQLLSDKLNAHYVVLDGERGIVRLLPGGGNDWQIDITTLQETLWQDIMRRDFSVNAMAINIAEMQLSKRHLVAFILDAVNGTEDLQNKTLRALSPQVFRDDPVRLLRGVRLSSELGLSMNEQTLSLVQRDSALISTAAAERVRDELLQIFALTNTYEAVDFMNRFGLLSAVMPELSPTCGLKQPPEHTWDVFQHSARSIAAMDFILRRAEWEFCSKDVLASVPCCKSTLSYFDEIVSPPASRSTLTKLAALLHDIAKPQTRMLNELGKVRFHGHPQQGAPIAAAILERLRFSHRESKFIEAIVRNHLRPVQMTENEAPPTRRAIYRYRRDLDEAGIAALYFSLADHLATRGPNLERGNWDRHVNNVRRITDEYEKAPSPAKMHLLCDGNDLQNELGLKPGRQLGRILEELREAQAAGEVTTRQQGLAYAGKLIAEEPPGK